jgi:hypothetical protein
MGIHDWKALEVMEEGIGYLGMLCCQNATEWETRREARLSRFYCY